KEKSSFWFSSLSKQRKRNLIYIKNGARRDLAPFFCLQKNIKKFSACTFCTNFWVYSYYAVGKDQGNEG
ncbi:MAG: hypothetical protein IIV03_02595, partial [Clostridia bacterium]|nr:hypothetical protein [Clostridia bacterium]